MSASLKVKAKPEDGASTNMPSEFWINHAVCIAQLMRKNGVKKFCIELPPGDGWWCDFEYTKQDEVTE